MNTFRSEQENQQNNAIQPFKIEVSKAELGDLNQWLKRTRWSKNTPGTGWERGVPNDYLKKLADYWQNTYDWREQEVLLNESPQLHFRYKAPLGNFLFLMWGFFVLSRTRK